MQKNSSVQSKTLFSTPFSKAYWRQAASEFKSLKMLLFAALVVALRVALKSVSIPIAADLRIGVGFFVNAFGAMIYGPVVAAAGAAVSDTLGALLFPSGPYFPLFLITEIAGSVIFALFLYSTRVTALRVILSRFCIDFFVNIVLNTPVMMAYYSVMLGKSYKIFHWPRIVKNLAMFPIESVLLILFLRAVIPAVGQLGTVPGGVEDLRFTRKNITILAVFTVIGMAAVILYATAR
ncbi:MAG: folate family ECF transporter S component [Clostridia bacterium]|nr:folate family ECF transporter S component [Clostridia bacterium]